jgi:uncharacterized membrane protein YbaN (DUF454 family)
MKQVWRYACLAIGTLSLVLGVIGVFVPMWPTTPFLLLTAACYIRSSERLYRWLIEHRHLGRYVRDYMSGNGIPLRAKRVSLALMWLTSQASWIIVMSRRGVQTWTVAYAVLLFVVAVGVHYYIGFRIPTRREEPDSEAERASARAEAEEASA